MRIKSRYVLQLRLYYVKREYIRCKCHWKGVEWLAIGLNNQGACNRGSQYTNDLEAWINTLHTAHAQRLGDIRECIPRPVNYLNPILSAFLDNSFKYKIDFRFYIMACTVINDLLQFRPNNFVVVMDFPRMNFRVHSFNVTILFNDWELIKPNNSANIC